MYNFKGPNLLPKSVQVFTSAADIVNQLVTRQSDVLSLNAVVGTSPTVTATVITYYYRPIYGSDTGIVTLGTVTIPVGATIGKVYKKNIAPYSVKEGGEIRIAVSTTSTAGGGQPYVVVEEDCEADANSSNVIISA
jgi:hypothetical protein